MCGFVGVFGNLDQHSQDRLPDPLTHRGPDNAAVESLGNLHFAHTRLSIIDLSAESNQPLWDIHKKACIVFNGEIYNYQDLRNELVELGYQFLSQGDAEVLVNLYLHFGIDCLTKLNGIFAFAIWDTKTEELIVVRDGFGVKPLYYTENEQGFYCSSEIKALLELPGFSKELNYDALFRTIVFLWSPGPNTVFKSIFKLQPGWYLVVKDRKIIKQEAYWSWPVYKPHHQPTNQIIDKLDELMQKSVQEQSVADVPIGAFLSGGVDSSLIVALAKKAGASKLQCFTIKSSETEEDNDGFENDLPYAKKVAEYLGVDLHVVDAKPNILKLLPKMIYHLDEPQADPAAINVMLISELARNKGVKVLFSGAGGDDVFTGYRRHQAIGLEKYWSGIPTSMRMQLQKIARKLPKRKRYLRLFSKVFSYAGSTENNRILSYFYWIDPAIVRSLFTDEIQTKLSEDPMSGLLEELASRPESNKLEKMLYLERRYFLIDHNFNYTDKMSMAHGVEVRVPFANTQLAQFTSNIPTKLKQKKRQGKWVLKKLAERYLPKSVVYRSKSGFGAPLRRWLKQDLNPLIQELLSEENLLKRGLFKPEAVHSLIQKNNSGQEDYSYPIFALLCIEVWFKIFIDNDKSWETVQ